MRANVLLRRAAWLVAAMLLGGASGAGASKIMWNYFWSAPSIRLPADALPRTLTLIRGGGDWNVASKEERDKYLQEELRQCRPGGIDCTYGRALAHWEPQELLALASLERASIRGLLDTAERLYPTGFLPPRQSGIGVVVSLNDGSAFVAFQTYELSNDTHGVVEVWFNGSGISAVRRGADRYFFDVAGLEFLTPPLLVSGGALIGLVIVSMVGAVRGLSSPVGREEGDP